MEVASNKGAANEKKDAKKVVLPRSAADIQRFKLEKLLKNPDKPVFIPEKPQPKLPRVFNPPEFIRNIWGSSAGAGSGDFHVYRGIRRREYARQKFMNIKAKKDELDEEFQKRLEAHKKEAVLKTDKKRAKRLKKKQKLKEAKKKKLSKKTDDTKKDEESDSDNSDTSDKSDIESGDECGKGSTDDRTAAVDISVAAKLSRDNCSDSDNSGSGISRDSNACSDVVDKTDGSCDAPSCNDSDSGNN
jgi:hypothetical protein